MTRRSLQLMLAERFLAGLARLGHRSSARYIVDYLPPDVARELFEALLELCSEQVQVTIPLDGEGNEVFNMLCRPMEHVDLVPFLVTEEPNPADHLTVNQGRTGFASALRDHYAIGARRERLLVVLTQDGNETQRSARDQKADRQLVDLEGLLSEVREDAGVAADADLKAVADAYLDYRPDEPWMESVARYQDFVEKVADVPTEKRGDHLPMLGCFLPDSGESYAEDEGLRVLSAAEHSRRERGTSRLHHNALLHDFLTETFEDPLGEPMSVLAEIFEDPDRARRIAERGVEGLRDLNLLDFEGAGQIKRRAKNTFVRDEIEVIGASAHRVLGSGSETLLVMSAPGSVTIRMVLEQGFNNKKEHAQLLRFDPEKGRLAATTVDVEFAAKEVVYELPAPTHGDFEVIRLALTPGPRTMKNPRDSIIVVRHTLDADHVVVEATRQPSLDDQAWTVEGQATFIKYGEDDERPLAIVEQRDETQPGEDDPGPSRWRAVLEESPLKPYVVEVSAEDDDGQQEKTPFDVDLLEQSVHLAQRYAAKFRDALRKPDTYLAAVRSATALPGARKWQLDLEGGLTQEVFSATPEGVSSYAYERAVGVLLRHTASLRASLTPDGLVPVEGEDVSTLASVLSARAAALEAIAAQTRKVIPRLGREDAAVLLPIVDLQPISDVVEAWCDLWTEAVRGRLGDDEQFTAEQATLLQLDTLRFKNADGEVERVVVLPTHPWMLRCLLGFQRAFQDALGEKGAVKLSRGELPQLIPTGVIEHWYLGGGSGRPFELTASSPFHTTFVREDERRAAGGLAYVRRTVSTKVERYLRMHPHLRNERRTLRVGFVNPGDARHLLDGLQDWIRNQTVGPNRELPMERIPRLEVFLFTTREGEQDELGSAFDGFFREQVSAGDDNVFRQSLLARLAYRKCKSETPDNLGDSVHVCFVQGLVNSNRQRDQFERLNTWWDGGFGDGLLATPLRRTLSASDGLRSRRGLWLDPEAPGGRGTLGALLALQRACRYGDPDPSRAVFWDAELPDLASIAPMYEHSDWVVHLDRELSLQLFRKLGPTPTERPTIIEYSDQEVPETPGFDTITVTRRAAPYHEQLTEILQIADLHVPASEAKRKAAYGLLESLNALSGTWALDFLLGSLADERCSLRLKGNLGAALVFRWLKRLELSHHVVETNVGPAVPVLISLEDLLRVTPASGQLQRDGLVYRYSNEVVEDDAESTSKSWCDDLLVLYITRPEPGKPARLFGRIVEVKLGRTAAGQRGKAVEQVRGTHKLLSNHLSGKSNSVEAPFRHKQLSLLIKAQLEQAIALGNLDEGVYEFLDVPLLSQKLATGDYVVDYTIGHEGRHANGDVFLLVTTDSTKEPPSVELVDGARVVRISRHWLEWLAFEDEDAPTQLSNPRSTQPDLGRYGVGHGDVGAADEQQAPPPPDESDFEPSQAAEDEVVEEVHSEPSPETTAQGDAEQERPIEAAEARTQDGFSLADAEQQPVKVAPYAVSDIAGVVERLESALRGHKIKLETSPSAEEADPGPRLIRAYVRLEPGESIQAVRRISEDVARVVGTTSTDIHISNIPERHAVGLDLPVAGMSYTVTYAELAAHPSFDAAAAELQLGFCAGIDVTGRAHWADLSGMPHMLVAGTTGSGKTVFLRNVILTLILHREPSELVLRMSSSKPMDFRPFTRVPHAHGLDMARDPLEALALARELVEEMDRRILLISDALCENLPEYNEDNPDEPMPYIVAVFDEFSEMVASFEEKGDRAEFESCIGRLAQRARAAGIHLILCMQRPDANALKGAIKANVLHRFALKLPQNHDSRVILDENGAETLLGQGDMLYKDDASRTHRLQVPFLENRYLKRALKQIISGQPVDEIDLEAEKRCPL